MASRAAQTKGNEEIVSFNRDAKNYNQKLLILADEKLIAEFDVAIADNDNRRIYGLMNLKKLPKNHGMLFVFDEVEVVNMWMKRTKIPLDMIFINQDDVIEYVHHRAQPNSEKIISAQKPTKKVLEINAGLAEKLGIKVGQVIKLNYQNENLPNR